MFAVGCASLGERADWAAPGRGKPRAAEILADLAASDEAIQNFRAAGTFTIESPETDAIQRFRSGVIMFRRPAELYVQGNLRLTGMALFKLINVGQAFLIEFPASKKRNYYQLQGQEFESVPFPVSPADVAREMFFPERWRELKRRDVRIVDFDPVRQVATVLIGGKEHPRRTLDVARINPQNPRWVMLRNERLESGRTVAITTLDNYRVLGETVFPATVSAYFPTEATRMTFEMRNIRINTELPDEKFDIEARARELNLVAGRAGK